MFEIKNHKNLVAFLEYEDDRRIVSPMNRLTQESQAILYSLLIILAQITMLWSNWRYELYYGKPEYIQNARPMILLYSTYSAIVIIVLTVIVAICTVCIYRAKRRYSVFFSEIATGTFFPILCLFCLWGAIYGVEFEPYIVPTPTIIALSVLIWLTTLGVGSVLHIIYTRREILRGGYSNGSVRKRHKVEGWMIGPIFGVGVAAFHIAVTYEDFMGSMFMYFLVFGVSLIAPSSIVMRSMKWHYAKKFGYTEMFTNEEYEKRKECLRENKSNR